MNFISNFSFTDKKVEQPIQIFLDNFIHRKQTTEHTTNFYRSICNYPAKKTCFEFYHLKRLGLAYYVGL